MTSPLRQVTIVGLGLIGGSIARALRHRNPNLVLVAIDRAHVGARADVCSVINHFVDVEALASHRKILENSDITVLCQPVRVIASQLSAYVAPGCVVTDTGSTKRSIVEASHNLDGAEWFVPGHPMAGKEQGGFENATPDLFVGRPWILCQESCNQAAFERVAAFVDSLGARRISMSPSEHDAAVAAVSHVPQVLSSLLLVTAAARNALPTAGPAFADMTRVAGGEETIWRDILETNAREVGQVLREASRILSDISDGLLADPPSATRAMDVLRHARQLKTSS
jgi:prephenate dehydrogenase